MSGKITNTADIDARIGINFGEHNHHTVALICDGIELLPKALSQNETQLRILIPRLRRHGRLLVVVDQPATVGALPFVVAQAESITLANLQGIAMCRIADLHPPEAKTDPRDAALIAEAERTMPLTLRGIRVTDENVAELSMLCASDDDTATLSTAKANRTMQIHP
ncbi:IS110 family transposase [Brevibacterium antiquum]|uniref:Transposase n=1 Tax=Brevibacterium antiquum TaxID=234835 RepID=A0A2H1KMV5_9MICO|nr:transposase [Brevibacterium antiquum]SMY01041.1 Transposase [Brevibacterium antiquum]